jgi:CHAT domain-containing protein
MIRRCWLFAFLVLLSGYTIAGDLGLSSLAQQGKNHELIHELQPQVDSGKDVSSFQLMLLGNAYYQVRKYRNANAIAELMEKRIAAGDKSYLGSDLSIFPELIRAAIKLDQGEYEDAIEHANIAHGNLKQNQFFYRWQLIQIDNILGVSNAFLGHVDEARKNLEEINKVNIFWSNIGPEKYVAMARIYMALKEYDKALSCINDKSAEVSPLLKLFYDPSFQDVPKFFIRWKSLFETGQVKEAKHGYDQLLKHPQIAQFGGVYWLILYDRARIARAEGDIAGAIEFLKKAVEIIEQQRSSIDSESGRIGFVGDKQAVYQTLVSLLLAEGRDDLAFEYVERSKARALVDLLASQKAIKVSSQNTDAGNTLLKLTEAEAATVALPAPEDHANGAHTRGLAIELRKQLQNQAPELASLVTVTNTPSNVIQTLLQSDEALLEYYYTEQELVVFFMTSETIKAIKLDRAGLENSVRQFRASLASPDSTNYLSQSRSLYDRLIKPIVELLRVKRLVFVPHGILHYLPFSALHSDKSFLIDDHSIRVEPSAGVLNLIKDRDNKAVTSALVMGNPDLLNPELDLEYAQEEAMTIAKLMPDAKVLLRSDATSSFVKSQGDRYSIIHFATHGVFDPNEPLNSALLLAPAQGSDGRLTVSALYDLKLDATLVTLSACETALGKVANGDDVVGFTRGFLYAGSRSIVASLWSVDDKATAALMQAFYGNLGSMNKQEALRQAQIKTREAYPHPFYWAAFQLTGRAE